MKITDARVVVSSPRRNYVTLVIETGDGITGTMTAIAAIDVALWDIKGKAAGMPVYKLLGGAAREGVMVYGHASGSTLEDVASGGS